MVNSLLKIVTVLAVLLFSFNDCFPANEINDDEVIVRPNSFENVEKLKNLGQKDLAEELSGQYQGDIIISERQLREYEMGSKAKTGLLNTRYHWQNRTVPYRVLESHFNQEQIDYIHLGAKRLEEVTCLKFVPYNPNEHQDYVTVQGSGSGCYSSVGRRGGQQTLNLQPYSIETGCFRLYTIVHEFLHAIGFYHMQSATERDEYVRIEFDKIQPGTANNFNTYGSDVISNYGVEYDYGSVMHYSSTAFSIDGSDTIIPLRDLNGETMGQRLRISDKDIARANRLYCDEPIETTTTEAPTTTTETPTTTTTESVPTTTSSPVRPNPVPEFVQSINDFVNNLLKNILGSFKF